MGCLNSNQGFSHWFANIHLSGPCNRSCYFCIGQHMMELDSLNNLNQWPLLGFDEFIAECERKNVRDVYLTGTNTDAMLYKHAFKLRSALPKHMRLGFRTNGVAIKGPESFKPFDMGSITICSLNPKIYKIMMGNGSPPNINDIVMFAKMEHIENLKINIVLGPENELKDLLETIKYCDKLGIERINLREPYGQPRIGDPLKGVLPEIESKHGSPTYYFSKSLSATYWDVHYVEVESVNLYADGRISLDYPITRGHTDLGIVKDQSNFIHGRQIEQWVGKKQLPIVM